ncbi:MAG TPA: tRNA (adenosine(37)-N6)-dimethylallyltransferase MiaA [Flexilinea sp.]|nr:tRNA (adenosine(37)-N6)-dimethylallyltransferase MiaA [Flexilinea sp.]
MSQHPSKIPVTVIVGSTAVGKTAFAIELAKIANAEIVSADSRYFYRGMDIGTAKPTPEERQSIPHHLIDVADPDETWSLALFQQKAYDAIASIHERGKNVIVVGGTGQYIRALLQGWSPPTMEADLVMRAVLEDWANEIGPMEIHKKLAILDPIAAEKIDYRNVRRTIRALEVIFGSGQRFSEQRKVTESPYSFLILGLNRSRSSLYQRIDQRIDQMIRQGFIEEVAGLLEKGYSPALPSMSAIGYREISAYLNHEITLDEAIRLIKQRTRNFVRRQANWFKTNDPQIHWFNLEG